MSRRVRLGLKLIVSMIAFLSLSILAAFCIRDYSSDHSSELKSRDPASVETRSVFEHRGDLSASELGVLGSTVLLRGRRVIFHEDVFRQAVASGQPVALNLFPDLAYSVKFQDPSAYRVNEDLFVGQVMGDDESSVRIMIAGGVMDATIITRQKQFRVFDGGQPGVHFVTEADKH